MALRLTEDEKRLVSEAADSHYLAGAEDENGLIAGYGVPADELSESETEDRKTLLRAIAKIRRDLGEET